MTQEVGGHSRGWVEQGVKIPRRETVGKRNVRGLKGVQFILFSYFIDY
jgi:hypothetical protein